VLVFHSTKAIPAHAGLFQHALIAAGLEPTLGENPNVPIARFIPPGTKSKTSN
jgi:hypothetical protein